MRPPTVFTRTSLDEALGPPPRFQAGGVNDMVTA